MRNNTGKTGKVFNDRVLAAEVRTLTLEEIKKALKGKDAKFKKELILRMSTSILPRINAFENGGGEPFEIIVKLKDAKGNRTSPTAI